MKILKDGIEMCDVVDTLNFFEVNNLFAEKDMYECGEWLYADVDYNNEKVSIKLDELLIDINEYRKENNIFFAHSEENNIIGLSFLVDHVQTISKTRILYSPDNEFFSVE